MAAKMPMPHYVGMKPWDPDQIQQRIKRRIDELGRPAATLLGEKDYPEYLIRRVPALGHRIDTLDKIADALLMPLASLLGIEVSAPINDRQLRIALEIAIKAIGSNRLDQANLDQLATFLLKAYESVAAMETERPDLIGSPDATAALEVELSRSLRNQAKDKS